MDIRWVLLKKINTNLQLMRTGIALESAPSDMTIPEAEAELHL